MTVTPPSSSGFTINWALLASIASALGGAVGTILTPIYGSNLTSSVQGVLQAVSGLLMAIGAYHAGAIVQVQSSAVAAERKAAALERQLGAARALSSLPNSNQLTS